MALEVGDSVDLDVGAVAHGGACVARHEGLAVFVRHALPDERVTAVITEVRRDYARADAVEVVSASADRVEPPCPWARPGLCGGCDWQHATLAAQRSLKAQVVADQLSSVAGLTVDSLDLNVPVEPVPGDEVGLGWRTRVQYAVAADGTAGLRRHRSHDVVPIDWCRIASPGVVELGVPDRRWPGAASVEAVAGSSGDRAVIVTPLHRKRRPALPPMDGASLLVADPRSGEPESVRGRPGVREVALDRTFWVGGSGFWQVHPGAAGVLAAAVLAGLSPEPGELAVDLYAGVGLFTAALAEAVGPTGEVVSIEGARGSVADARVNLRDLPWARIHEGRVDAELRRLGLGRADAVVLDPPRTGAGATVVALIAGLAPRAVCYVACDPAALGRDLAAFAALGYRVDSLRAFDLFPMTHHVECVATLRPA